MIFLQRMLLLKADKNSNQIHSQSHQQKKQLRREDRQLLVQLTKNLWKFRFQKSTMKNRKNKSKLNLRTKSLYNLCTHLKKRLQVKMKVVLKKAKKILKKKKTLIPKYLLMQMHINLTKSIVMITISKNWQFKSSAI